MPHVELYINDQLVDLKGDESIEVDYSIFDIEKIDKRGGARSYEFNLPKTNRNKSVLENPEMVNNISDTPYTRLKCRCYVDGVDVKIRFAEISQAGSEYAIRLYGSNSDFYQLINDLKLWDLDLSAYDHIWELDVVYASRLNTEGYIYAIIDHHEDSPNSYINNDNRTLRVDYMPPSIFVNTILGKIISEAGYSFVNEISDDTAQMIMPLHFNPIQQEVFLSTKYDGVLHTNLFPVPDSTGNPTIYYFDFSSVTSYAGDYYDLPYTVPNSNIRALRIEDRIYFKMTVSFDVTFLSSTNFISVIGQFYDSNGALIQNYIVSPVTSYSAGTHNITVEVNYISIQPIQRVVYVTFGFINTGGLFGDSSPFTVEASSTVTVSDVVSWGQLLIYGNFLPISALMPDMTQLDFIKNYLQLFGLMLVVNEDTSTVTFRKFDSILSFLSAAYDWSNKLDLSEEAEIKFILDKYAQNNWFKYAQDGEEPIPVDANQRIQINNKNLEFEKDIVELDFAHTNSFLRLNDAGVGTNLVPQIGVYKDGVWANEKLPRYLNLTYKTSADIGGSMGYAVNGSQIAFNDNIPFCYFIDANETFNLGFGNNILENYYVLISGLLNKLKVISLPIRLSASDISQLDFSRPVWIEKYESYFYISAIKGFSYTESKSTLVELVKLNING